MPKPTEDNKLLTSNPLARACGLSRSTVLRMEERGFIKPIDRPHTGSSRYYDVSALFNVKSVLIFQELGFDNQTIRDFIDNNCNYNVLKYAVSKKIREAVGLLDIISNYTETSNHLSVQESRRNGYIAYAEEVPFTRDWEKNKDLIIGPILHAARKGYEIDSSVPAALVIPDIYINDPENKDATAKAFIPINPVTIRLSESRKIINITGVTDLPKDPLIVSMEDADYTSITWHGSLKGFDQALELLNEHLDKEGIETYDYTHIAFYSGEFYGGAFPEAHNYVRVFKKHK